MLNQQAGPMSPVVGRDAGIDNDDLAIKARRDHVEIGGVPQHNHLRAKMF